MFSLQFERTPSDDEKRELARSFVLMAAGTVINLDEVSWRWSQRFATVAFGVKWWRGRAHLAAFTDFLMAARHILPIVDVVYLNAIDAVGRWDRWSLEQGPPDPGPGPELGASALARPLDSSLPEPAADAAFDSGLADAIAARQERMLERKLAEAEPDEISVVATDIDADSLTQSWELEWPDEVLAAFDIPTPATEWVKYGTGGYHRELPGDHLVKFGAHPEVPLAFVIDENEKPTNLALVSESEGELQRQLVSWQPGDEEAAFSRSVASSEDGKAVFLAAAKSVYRLDQAEARLDAIWTVTHEHQRLYSVAWLGDDRLLAVTEKKLVVLDVSAEGQASVVTMRQNGGGRGGAYVNQTLVPEGSLVITYGYGKSSIVSLLFGKSFKKAGEIPKEVTPLPGPSGQIFFTGADGVYSLSNVDAAVAKHRPKKKPEKKKKPPKEPKPPKPAKPKKPPAPTLEEHSEPLPKLEEPVLLSERQAFPKGCRVIKSGPDAAQLRLVAMAPPKQSDVHAWAAKSFPRLFIGSAQEEGLNVEEVTEAMPEGYYATASDILPDGTFALLMCGFDAWRLELESKLCERVWTNQYREQKTALCGGVDKGVAAVLVDAERALVLGEKGLALMTRGADGWSLAHSVKLNKPKRLLYCREHGYALVLGMGTKRLLAFAVLEAKLKKLFEDKSLPAVDIRLVEGEAYALGRPKGVWRVAGLGASSSFEVRR